MKRQNSIVGRATVPAETGQHGGRPYDSTRPKFLFRFDWTPAARGEARMKLGLFGTLKRLNVEHRTPNIEHPMLMVLRFIYFKRNEPRIFQA
jgi:hypothetical protein